MNSERFTLFTDIHSLLYDVYIIKNEEKNINYTS